MNTQLTQAAKDTLFSNCEYIINTIYYLCGGKVLHAQLIALLEEMNLPYKSTTQIKVDITSLIKGGFLKKKQVLSSNSNILILTSYPLSKLLNTPSRDVTEIATSKKTILEGICRIEFIINDLHSYRLEKKTNKPLTIEEILKIMDLKNSTVCTPLKDTTQYLYRLYTKYGAVLSDDFADDYKYLEVIRMQKSNNLSKSQEYIIDPDWLKIKESQLDLRETMSTEMQNRSLYNFYNLKNSSADVNFLVIKKDGRIYVRINIYDNGNLTLERIASLTSYFFLMFSKYCIHFEKPHLYIFVQCSSEDIKEDLENQAEKKVQNFYGMRDATLLTQLLITNGIRVQYLEDISITFINLNIDENYHIYY